MQSVTSANFQQEVLESTIPVIVDFWAEWCGPCRALKPVLQEMSTESEQYKIVSVDIDQCQDLASKYAVSAIPTVLVFKNGEESKRLVGLAKKTAYLEAVQ